MGQYQGKLASGEIRNAENGNDIVGSLTVFFENPFWVGVFERTENGSLSAAKITFGAEPKDYEVYAFILRHYTDLNFSSAVACADVKTKPKNPKRARREISKQMSKPKTGTKSQQALQLQREENKRERKQKNREAEQTELKRRFAMRRLRKKEKHRGH